MLGDSGSGKTSMVLRFAEGYFRDGDRSSTIGAFFITKRIQTSNGITCKIQIWDTAGKAQFRSMAPMYYRSAAAAIICYDVTSRASYKVMTEWLDELHRSIPAGSIVIAIAATKYDTLQQVDHQQGSPEQQSQQQQMPLPFPGASSSSSTNSNTEEKQQSPQHNNDNNNGISLHREAEHLARTLGHIYVPTSAKENIGINQLFQQVAERVLWFRKQGEMGVAQVPIPVTPGAVATSLRHHNSHHYSPKLGHSRSVSSSVGIIQTSPITSTGNRYRGLDASLDPHDSIILLNSTPSNPGNPSFIDKGESSATVSSILHPSILSTTTKDGNAIATSTNYPPDYAYQMEISSAEDDLLLDDAEAQAAAFRMARSPYANNNSNIRPNTLCTDGSGIICDLFSTSTRQGSSHGDAAANSTSPTNANLRPLADTTTCCIS